MQSKAKVFLGYNLSQFFFENFVPKFVRVEGIMHKEFHQEQNLLYCKSIDFKNRIWSHICEIYEQRTAEI